MSTGHRYVTVTEDDHSGHLWVVVCVCLGFSLAAVFARGASKFRFSFKFGLDDYVILVALALLIVQCSLTIAALVNGLGKSENVINQDHVDAMYRLFTASQALLYAGLYAVKCSMVFLIMRLFNKTLHPIWIVFLVLGVASVIMVSAGCSEFECHNSGPVARWSVLTVLDISSEIVITIIPIIYIRSIQMKLHTKLKVLLSLNIRLLTIIFAILNLADIIQITHKDGTNEYSHPTIAIIIPALYLQSELTLSFVTASVLPCFRLLFSSSDTQRVELSEGATIGSWDPERAEKRRAAANAAKPPMDDSANHDFDFGPRTERRPPTTATLPTSTVNSKTTRGGEKQGEGAGSVDSRASSQGSWSAFPAGESRQASLRTKSSQTPFIVAEHALPARGVV